MLLSSLSCGLVTAILVRSQGSGGLATGLAYNPGDDQVVLVGTTFEKTFWDMSLPKNDKATKGECFVAVGDVSHQNQEQEQASNFARLVLDMPAVCFGGTSTINHDQEGGFGVASVLGMKLTSSNNDDSDNDDNDNIGFAQSIMYYLGHVQPSSNEPTDLPVNLLPVASTGGVGGSAATYIGLHAISDSDIPFGNSNNNDNNPLRSLLQYWWHTTYPPYESMVRTDDTFTAATKSRNPKAPHVRKQDIFTGRLSFDVSLEPTDASTALIAGLILPSMNTGDQKMPLIVVGSTNSADIASSLFGQSSPPKNPVQTDWDGYVLFLDPDTGALFEEEQEQSTAMTEDGTEPLIKSFKPRSSIRINSLGDDDDFVQGLCLSPNQRYLYIVGTTQGILQGIHKGGAFLIKYDLNVKSTANGGNTIEWQYQLNGLNVQGLTCTADQDAVYLGGSTESDLWEQAVPGGNNIQPIVSPDAFVTKISAIDGHAKWTRPLDTTLQEDGDRRRELIVGMEMTSRGYVLVLINSMNLETGANDVFLVDLDPETGENDLYDALQGLSDIIIPTFGNENGNEDDDNIQDKRIVIVASVIPVVIALLLFGFTYWRHRTDVEGLPKAVVPQEYREQEENQPARVPTTPRTDEKENAGVV